MLRLSRILRVMAALAMLALAGCNGDSHGGDPTATEQPTDQSQATATADPGDGPNIRSEDLTEQLELNAFLVFTGGVVDASRNQYADLTGSGADEAIVSVSSGGEGGDFAIFVFGYDADGEIDELLRAITAATSMVATIEDGQLKITEGVFAPGDIGVPTQLLHRYYAWDGSAFVIEREEQEPA